MPGCGAAANAPLLRSKPGKSSTSYAAAHTGPDNWSAPSTCFKTANSAPPRKDEKGSMWGLIDDMIDYNREDHEGMFSYIAAALREYATYHEEARRCSICAASGRYNVSR